MPTTTVPGVFDAALFIPELRARRKESVLTEMVARAHETDVVRGPEHLTEMLAVRERVGSTALGKSVALPNLRSVSVLEPRLLVARSRRGIDWRAPDGRLVHLVLMVLSPPDMPGESHHSFLAKVASLVRLQRNRQKLMEAVGPEAIAPLLREVIG